METKPYTEDDVERIRRFLVRELYTARTLVKRIVNSANAVERAKREGRIEGINNAIKAVDEIFEVYTSESCDWRAQYITTSRD